MKRYAYLPILFLVCLNTLLVVNAQEADCPMETRLTKGQSGQVVANLEVNVRADKPGGTSIARISGGTHFYVADGPVCVSAVNWWLVKTSRYTGYVAEGQNDTYLVEPFVFAPPTTDTQITFFSNESGFIEAIDSDGQNRREITRRYATIARLSPDGKAITFIRDLGDGDYFSVYVYYFLDDALLRLTFSRPSESPAWSPDGQQVVYMSADDNGITNLYVYDIRANEEHVLTAATAELQPNMPDWSPDGGRIVFSGASNASLVLIDVDGENMRQLVERAAVFPVWSPDGAHIAYINLDINPQSTTHEISIVDVTTGETHNTGITATYGAFAWSPDGTQFVVNRDEAIYIANVDGSAERLLVEKASFPDWGIKP